MGMEPPRTNLTGGYALGVLALGFLAWVGIWLFGPLAAGVLLAGLLLSLPILVALAIALVLIGVHIRYRHAKRGYHRRMAGGRCVRCGYDLRGAAHEVCPECGMPVWRARDPRTGRAMRNTGARMGEPGGEAR